MQYMLAVFYGLVFGVANIIPGVSGGTMLVVFGCYDKVCGALSFDLKEIKKNIKFLIFFGIGAVLGIIGFSFVITWLFETFPTAAFMFFIGLIIGSIPLIIRNATVKEKFKPICIFPFAVALCVVISLSILESVNVEPYSVSREASGETMTVTIENNSDRTIDGWSIEILKGGFDVRAWTAANEHVTGADTDVKTGILEKIKDIIGSDADRQQYINIIRGNEETRVIRPHSSVSFSYNNAYTHFSTEDMKLTVSYAMDVGFFLMLVVVSFTAAIAMIIPGVSGSFIMVLFGTYGTVIAAIKSLNFPVLIPTAVGVIAGLVLGARAITYLLKQYRLMVFSAVMGLVVGSIYAILPPGFGLNSDTFIGSVVLIGGAAISYLIGKKTKTEE